MARVIYEKALALSLVEGFTIVPVPIHWTRRCFRGFNQTELLVEAFPPEQLGTGLIQRIRATKPQARLNPEEREANLFGAFAGGTAPDKVLLVDDVYTSGHTARECARVLKSAGARQVGVISFASGD